MAGHVTTQNLGAKKSVGREGWQSVLIVAVGNFVGLKTSSSRLKKVTAALSRFDVLHRRLSFTKKLGSPTELKLFDG